MAKVRLTRITKEDFPKDYDDLLDKLLYPINSALEQLSQAMNNGLSVTDNIAGQETSLDITAPVNSANPIFFKKSTLKGTCKGITCIEAIPQNNGIAVTGQPFFTFEDSGNNIKVTNITNLTAGSRYILRVYCYA